MRDDLAREPVAVGAQLRLLGAAPATAAGLAALALGSAAISGLMLRGLSDTGVLLLLGTFVLYRASAGAACGVLAMAGALLELAGGRPKLRRVVVLSLGLMGIEAALLVLLTAAFGVAEGFRDTTSAAGIAQDLVQTVERIPRAILEAPFLALHIAAIASVPGLAAFFLLRSPPRLGARQGIRSAKLAAWLVGLHTLLFVLPAFTRPASFTDLAFGLGLAGLLESVPYVTGFLAAYGLAREARTTLTTAPSAEPPSLPGVPDGEGGKP
ncbi:MAG: hypothetical protein L0216_17135 [Planctomycetales bacterium]|nr:hypothetical protein [Planctomycetales bacterium]